MAGSRDDGSPSPSSENHHQSAMMTQLACGGARGTTSRDNAHGSVKSVQFARIRSPVRGSAAVSRIEKSETDVDDRHRHCRDAAPRRAPSHCRSRCPWRWWWRRRRKRRRLGGHEEALAAATSVVLAVVLGASAAVISVGASAVVSGALVATSEDWAFPAAGPARDLGLVHSAGRVLAWSAAERVRP